MYITPLLGQTDLDHPVLLNELKRLPVFRATNWSRFFAVLGGLEYIFTLPGCWIPFVHWLWRLPGLLASATVISREVENRTWDQLAATPLSLREIVYAKHAAILRHMEPQLTLVVYIRALPAVIIGVAWFVSTITVLPERGPAYWVERTAALVASGAYILIAPSMDVALDGAMGVLASTLARRRSTATIIAVLARASGWLLPLALVAPLQYGMFNSLFGGAPPDMITLRAIAIVATFGPGYAFASGIDSWLSVGLVVVIFLLRLGLIRLLLELAVVRAARIEA